MSKSVYVRCPKCGARYDDAPHDAEYLYLVYCPACGDSTRLKRYSETPK